MRTQARGATPELWRVADTNKHARISSARLCGVPLVSRVCDELCALLCAVPCPCRIRMYVCMYVKIRWHQHTRVHAHTGPRMYVVHPVHYLRLTIYYDIIPDTNSSRYE